MFKEEDHKRKPKGTPEGGQFCSSDNVNNELSEPSNKNKEIKQAVTDLSGLNAEQTKRQILNKQQVENKTEKVKLTKQEWALFYERIGKIKKEGHYIPKTSNGEMIIPIETDDSSVLVIASGTYQTPKVNYAVRCKSNNHLYEIIERLTKI